MVRVGLQASRARRSSMYVYCPAGERQQHLVMLRDTHRGTTGVMYPADPILETGTNMSYGIYNDNQKCRVNQIRCMQHTIYELMA